MNEWISVKDDSPGDYIDVLTYGPAEIMHVMYTRVDGSWSEDYEVTHWMPLPPPPEATE